MTEKLGSHMHAIKLVDPNRTPTNVEESFQELRKWVILNDVPEILLQQIGYAMVARRTVSGSGYKYAFMVTHDDQAYVIGDNRWGQLGVDQNTKYVDTPTKVEQLSGLGIIGFSPSWEFASAWTKDGQLLMMGNNEEGQLGQAHRKPLSFPRNIFRDQNVKVVKAACGSYHTVCLTTDGRVYAWGRNNYHQCFPESVDPVTTPTLVKFPTDAIKIVDVASTIDTSFALTEDGHLYSWGCNKDGETGTGLSDKFVQLPTKIAIPDDKKVKNISCGFKHCIVLTRNETLFAWGWNGYGELGTGNKEVARSPVTINLTNVVSVSATSGRPSSVCKTLDGNIYAWGQLMNSYTPKCTEYKSIHDYHAHHGIDMSETWTSKYSLDTIEPDCLSFLKLHANSKKITFLVEGTRITAPKFYLERCAAFQKKLKQEWKQEVKTSGVVKITGCKAKHFKIVTDFLQTDRAEAAMEEDLIDLFKLAHIYKMDRFRFVVINMIRKTMTTGNVVQFYIAASEYSDKTLHWETINFIKPRVSEFMANMNLNALDSTVVVKLLTDVQALGAFKSP